MKSDGAVVRTSNGTPPAARIASFTTFATPSRCAKHTASSDELLTTAILGLAMSASVRPRASQCDRRVGELAARLRSSGIGISPVLGGRRSGTRRSGGGERHRDRLADVGALLAQQRLQFGHIDG